MRRALHSLAPMVFAAVSCSLVSAVESQKLSVLFVGDTNQDRGRAFAKFLSEHFAQSASVHRDDFELGMDEDYDVVVLDWRQDQDNVGLDNMASIESPLGPRDEWDTPLVLLGSAGLLISIPWSTNGSWG